MNENKIDDKMHCVAALQPPEDKYMEKTFDIDVFLKLRSFSTEMFVVSEGEH